MTGHPDWLTSGEGRYMSTVGFGEPSDDFEDWGGLGPSHQRYPRRKRGARSVWYRRQERALKARYFLYGVISTFCAWLIAHQLFGWL